MPTPRRGRRRLATLLASATFLIAILPVMPAAANNTVQSLPFSQDWTNTGLITTANDWSAVPGIIGYRGDAMVGATAVDPQTVLADGAATPVNVIANATNPNTNTTGGIAEFDTLANPVVAFQGSGTARAPHLVLAVNTTGLSNIGISYNLRDVDGAIDNAVQPVALQYRVGGTGSYTNVPAGFVADASSGPSLATLVTAVNVILPAAVWNQPLVEIRIMTTDAVGSDEWIGIDDISVTGNTADQAPSVQSTVPANTATDVPVDSNITVTFSEPVTASPLTPPGEAFKLLCASGSKVVGVTGGPSVWTVDPADPLPNSDSCTLTVVATQVADVDTNDPPDTMVADFTASFTTAPVGPAAGDVVISEVYGGGGNAGATLKNDFIELYNRTNHAINVAGWSVQYASAAGTSWQVTVLTGSIPSGRNYLIKEALGAGGTVDLPIPDATGSIAMSATAGKVALVSNSTALSGACPVGGAIIDFVGFGTTANCFEGTGPTPAPSNTTSVSRNGGGATDTNNNAADFTAGTPDPHPTADQAPIVASTIPVNDATGVALPPAVSVTFSEAVTATNSSFTINCTTSGPHPFLSLSGGPTTFSIDPADPFVANETCTVTVVAANVSDQDSEDPPDHPAADYVFSFQLGDPLVCGAAATPIHDVQGIGSASPIVGTGVTIEGVVTAEYQDSFVETANQGGFYLQEITADADPMTSEGIFVRDQHAFDVHLGEIVRARGTVAEFFNMTTIDAVNAVAICSTGNPLPAPASATLPVVNVTDLERFEGMVVNFNQTLTATEVFNLGRFGEVALSSNGRQYVGTSQAAPGAPANAVSAQNLRSRIILDDGSDDQNADPTRYPQGGLSAANTLRVGDTLPALTGVMDFRFSNYRIQPNAPISFNHDNARTPAPAAVGGNLKVASFNVLNFFNGNGAGGGFPTERGATTQFELDRQKAKEVSALAAMNADIVGLMEIENDAGSNPAVAELVNALNASMGAGTYAFINNGVIGTDAIKVALIYKPAAVTPVGAFKHITTATDPRFIDTKNRPSLAQTFQQAVTGAKLTVVVNHLKSKGSDCLDVGDPDTGDGSGNCNITRTNATKALVDWLATDPTGSGDPDFLMIGDFNAYTFEDPIAWATTHGYTNLVRQYGGLTPYSYVFNGESGYLDQALATSSLAAQVTGTVDWHINPDEPTVLDYNVEFKTANQVNTFYDPGPYRSSDHDPVIIGLNLNSPPSVDAGGPYTVAEGGSVGVSATGSDPDNQTLTYAWDLDNNGSFETPGQNATFSAASIDGPATRTITVQATDTAGGSTVDSATVNVTNVAPTATLGNDGPVAENSPATISFSAPSDPSTADTGAGFHYAFSCTNGDLSSATYANSGTSTSTTCTFDDGPSSHVVKARIIDKDGGSSQYTTTVNVTNVAPTATLGNDGPVAENSPATISFSAPSDPSTADTGAGFHYAFSCTNGDLSSATYANSGTSTSTTCTFDDGPSSHVVKARIIDKDGGSSQYTTTVNVTNVAPTATFNAPTTVLAGFDFELSLTNPSDPSASDTTAGFSYAFDCGSGYGPFGSASSVTCTTSTSGTRDVGGIIRDKDGDTTEYRAVVNVEPSARSTIEDVQTQVNALIVGAAKPDANKLKEAANALNKALDPRLWIDPMHVTSKDGQKVFDRLKDAVQPLKDVLKRGVIPTATTQGLIDDLVGASRMLARTAIDDAIAAGAPADKVDRALTELAKGDADAAKGDALNAIEHYKKAWQRAQDALN